MIAKSSRLPGRIPILLLLATLVFAGCASGGGANENSESFSVNAISTTAPRSTATFTIRVDRWTTDEEREQLANAVVGDSSESLIQALRAQDGVGIVRPRNHPSRTLRFSTEQWDGETRHIFLATDRPIAGFEAARNTRTLDYNISLIHLEVDAEGNGTGTMMIGAEVEFNAETGQLEVTHASMQPVQLTRVRPL